MVRFVNLEGKTKHFRRQMSEIHFDIKPESVGKYAHLYDSFTGMNTILMVDEFLNFNLKWLLW